MFCSCLQAGLRMKAMSADGHDTSGCSEEHNEYDSCKHDETR